jgi:hypothetical protein
MPQGGESIMQKPVTRSRFTFRPLVALLVRQGLMLRGADDGLPTSKEALDKLIAEASAAAIESATAGLKAKNQELLGSIREAKDNLKKFDGIDPEAVSAILKRFTDGEEADLIKAGKIDEVLGKRTERMKANYDKLLGEANGKAEAAAKRAKSWEGRVLDEAIRAAAAKAGLHQHAIDDALFRARSMFSLTDDGQAVALDESGKPQLGKDGKTPFAPSEWLDGMKEKAPHWFPASASGGGAGGGGGGGGGNASKANWAGSEAERVAAINQKFPGLKSA